MGTMKNKLIEEQIKADEDFASEVQEENARVSKFYEDRASTRPQHVIDEERVDDAILERHDQRQREMFDDPYMNWSGQR